MKANKNQNGPSNKVIICNPAVRNDIITTATENSPFSLRTQPRRGNGKQQTTMIGVRASR